MITRRAAHRDGVMCRNTLSIDFQGTCDCDFNQTLELNLTGGENAAHLRDLQDGELPKPIGAARHCFGCTAGQGSGCGGTLA